MQDVTVAAHPRDLNPQQLEAIEHGPGPLLVLAGAGSGKTRVVTQRIAHLIEKGTPPEAILGVTFTNKAAGEMQHRVRSLTQCYVLISTFHSLGTRILRENIHHLGYHNGFTIYDETDTEKVVKACMEGLQLNGKKQDASAMRHAISRAKSALLTPENLRRRPDDGPEMFPDVYAEYQKRLQEYQAVDFDDLLMLTVRLLREFPEVRHYYQQRWQFVLIDEFQDTNESQYQMVRLIVEKHGNLCVVGDPDQSIYSWRGANVQNILEFEENFPDARVIRLEQNYRSSQHILDAANALISANHRRHKKNLWSDLGEGEKVRVFRARTDGDEVRFVAEAIRLHRTQGIGLNEMAVLYRTNSQSRLFEDILLTHRIPYVIVGGVSFYQRREVKDILAYLKMVESSHDYVAFERSVKIPKRGIGDVILEKLRHAALECRMPIFEYCRGLVADHLEEPVKLSAKQKTALHKYVQLIDGLRLMRGKAPLKEIVQAIIDHTCYFAHLDSEQESAEERRENLGELVSAAHQWQQNQPEGTLAQFLEELALKSSLDELEPEHQRLHLMTLHNGKGLEFKVIFLVGMEEMLLPHISAKDSEDQVEEERRLCYVGMTRAKEYLYLTHASQRSLWGTLRFQRPSPFLREVPLQHIKMLS